MKFLKSTLSFALLFTALVFFNACQSKTETQEEKTPDLNISLAQWSLHKSFFGNSLNGDWAAFGKMLMESPDSLLKGTLHPDDFPKIAAGYGVNTIELVNTFYYSKAKDMAYWEGFKKKCDDAGVSVGLIMCDALGDLGNADSAVRMKAVENHYDWVKIAKFLGAKSIRVNAAGQGTAEEVAMHAVDGLTQLGKFGAQEGINIIVENHGGYSSNGEWLSGVMSKVNMENVGTLPDFGNFCLERGPDGCLKEYDRYKGIAELMPYAKGVSAKTNVFDANGNERVMDYSRILKIVKDAGFKGNIGIEFEGDEISEDEGIKGTKALIEKVLTEK
ncbi:sugar phosphate isomerase/epimerase [Lacihabitans sp. LS3-19]|uniref:sugar phosphate isomerase/epimerase family protein n=1 Tax=Lacihabitans sp. LS3-19 TaxID=2487335 RepID=UPI0020CC4E86|nr:sugar phosphate isomerase/epimerase family protein [Lacihabitans sp. LS3-19]MCP9766283.1 sugar phosphate isomerase/epimerase [Lacihabitans sp. LS3-19]